MIRDIWTISKKDIKEILYRRGSLLNGLISILIPVGLVGVYLPIINQKEWFSNPSAILTWAWLPVFMVTNLVTDSIAGERERHTLETLLSSRAKDQSILLGKISASVLYGWGLFIAGILLAAVTANIVQWGTPLQFYPIGLFIGTVLLSLLLCIFISTIGVFVSLHASTARIAYQRLSYSMLGIFLIPTILVQVVPADMLNSSLAFLKTINLQNALIMLGIALFAIDIALILAALAQFKRARLILD